MLATATPAKVIAHAKPEESLKADQLHPTGMMLTMMTMMALVIPTLRIEKEEGY